MTAPCLLLALLAGLFADEPDLRTVAEASDYRATARHADVMALCRKLADSSRLARLDELGRTVEGRPIPLLIVADPPVATAEEATRSGKLVVLLVGNIHAGEVCGKEALPMLAREILAEPDHPLLKQLILAFVPIFNADGNERVAPNNRPGQDGPEQGMGQRPNARGLDLNRDFVKLESPEARALVRFLNRWAPHVVIDTHTTNGSHHRYTMTYMGPQNPAGDANILSYVRNTMIPAADAAFERATPYRAFFYGNFEGDHARWTTFPATPRFGTNYVGLRNRISILTEAYAYAPYRDRVLATRDFVRECLRFAADHADEIRKLLDRARQETIAAGREPAGEVAIRSKAEPFDEPATLLGYVEERVDGRNRSTGEPKDYKGVQVVQDYKPTATARRPFAYLVPPRYGEAIATLRRHGIEASMLREELTLPVTATRLSEVRQSDRLVEGHPVVEVVPTPGPPGAETRRIEAGTVVVRTAQPLGNLAVYLLEPSDDGLHTWNLFGDGLAAGSLFPVLRLEAPTPLLTAPLPPLEDETPAKKPITLSDMPGGPGGLNGSPASPRWLDADHLLQARDGRLHKVDARTGQSEPLFDPDALARGLATLPGIDAANARSLAREVAATPGGGGFGRRPAFTFDPEHRGVLFTRNDDLYYATLDGKTAVRLTEAPGAEELAEFSPDGRFVAFVRDNDLHVVDLATQRDAPLTTGGADRLRNGKADWVYFEEIYNRRSKAFWWSPDSSRLAFLQFDDAPVKDHEVVVDTADARRVERTPYPRAGDPNPNVRLGLVSVKGGAVRWHDLCAATEGAELISEVGWWPDGSAALAYVQDRAQTWLDVVKVPAGDGNPARLLRDTTKAWVESPGPPRFLADGSFLLTSERDGWKHLYRFAADGTLQKQVTSGDWEIRSVEHVAPDGSSVLFTATKDDPIAANLYRVSADGGAVERLTGAEGDHQVRVSPDGTLFVDTWSDARTPPRVVLRKADGNEVRTIDANPVPQLDSYRFGPRRRVQIAARDGFPLEAELILPADLDETKVYPVWFTTYGGPHAPTVTDAWSGGRVREQAMASEGFIVFRVDPRSASGKGARSTWAAYKQLGVQELADVEDAIAWLKREPCVDGDRIGMTGHSYGGFLTAYALTHSKLFAAGIAGAPVTDWRDYDSIYTERYMRTPQQNPAGYDRSSVVRAAGDLHGRLLILHGGIDDNVSVRNTMRLVHALQRADKDFELMIYPASRHGIAGPHYNRLQLDFLRRTLGGPRPRDAKAE